MALLDEMRTALRVSSEATDGEIQLFIDFAIADMRRCGVKESLLNTQALNPMAKQAIVCYCKSAYGLDNSEAMRFDACYKEIVISLLNSKANEYLFPEETGATDDPSEGNDGGSTPSTDDSVTGDPETGDSSTDDPATGDPTTDPVTDDPDGGDEP